MQKIIFDQIIELGIELPPRFDDVGMMLDHVAEDIDGMIECRPLVVELLKYREKELYRSNDDRIIHIFLVSIRNLFKNDDGKFHDYDNQIAIENSISSVAWCINSIRHGSMDYSFKPWKNEEGFAMAANMLNDAFVAIIQDYEKQLILFNT